jgi:hypothetical protein
MQAEDQGEGADQAQDDGAAGSIQVHARRLSLFVKEDVKAAENARSTPSQLFEEKLRKALDFDRTINQKILSYSARPK